VTGERQRMSQALQAVVVPKIRSLGFSGRLPHFRRERGSEHQTLSFMFNKYGGSFCVEAGRLEHSDFLRLQERWRKAGRSLVESSLNIGHCRADQRLRLEGLGTVDRWFTFGPNRYEAQALAERPTSHHSTIALNVVHAIESQLERFFARAL
jgi:Domain of unknown function (DUF4304)